MPEKDERAQSAGDVAAPPDAALGGVAIDAGTDDGIQPPSFDPVGALPRAMQMMGFYVHDIADAEEALARALDEAVEWQRQGSDGAVTLRVEAPRDGSRRVRIGVTAGGIAQGCPFIVEAPERTRSAPARPYGAV